MADSEFTISYGENGGLKQITLNSKSNFDENVGAVAKLFESLPSVAGAFDAMHDGNLKACDVGKKVQAVTPLERWLAAHPQPEP